MWPVSRFPLALLVAACCASSAAQSAVVHRCRQIDGVVAYRDTGCFAGETQIARTQFEAPLAASAPAATAPATQASRAARAVERTRSSRIAEEIVAHECRFGEQRWIQAEACPAPLAAVETRGGKPVRQRVEETRLTRSQVCGALRATSTAHAQGEGSARRAYGMNRLRQRHGC